jgi:hypothetical protein
MDAPAQGEPVAELWHYVAELVAFRNAMGNLKVHFNVPNPTTGKLIINKNEAILVLE